MKAFHRAFIAISYGLCGLAAAVYCFHVYIQDGMPIFLVGFLLGCVFWAVLGSVGYFLGLRAESALRIRRARARDHAKVPAINVEPQVRQEAQ